MDNQLVIDPYKDVNYERLVHEIRQSLNLDKYPFNLITDNLLLMCFVPKCRIDGYPPVLITDSKRRELVDAYGACDHQTLEYYGDRLLYVVVSDIVESSLALRSSPGVLSTIINYLTNNKTITLLFQEKGICQYVRSHRYIISKEKGKTHNFCGDSFEALLGAMFYSFKNSDFNYIKKVKDWLLKNTNIIQVYRDYLRAINMGEVKVFTASDIDALLSKQDDIVNSILDDRDEDIIQILNESYFSRADFSDHTLVVSESETLEEIYHKLAWVYRSPIYDRELDAFFMYGYPNGVRRVISTGDNENEALENGRLTLANLGYILILND